MAVFYNREKSKIGTTTGTIIHWSRELTSNDPDNTTTRDLLPAGYLRCDGSIYAAAIFPELAIILGVGSQSRYKKETVTLLDNQFQLPDFGSKKLRASAGSNLGLEVDLRLQDDNDQPITKSGVGLEVSTNIGTTYTIQYQGNFFLPAQTIEITGQPGFAKSTGNYTEETEVLQSAFQPHAHFHDGKRSRTSSPTSEFGLFGRNSYTSKSTLCIMPWANNTRQELCKAVASKEIAAQQQRTDQNGCVTFLVGGPSQELYTWYGGCWAGCTFDQTDKCLIPGNIPQFDANGVTIGTLEFGCSDNGSQVGFPIYAGEGATAPIGQCGNIQYQGEMSCKTTGQCTIGGASCNNYSSIGSGPIYNKVAPNYTPATVSQATQVPFDGQANVVTYGAINNTVTDIEEFGNECIHKHFVPFNQDPHTWNVVTKPTYIPASNITSTVNIDVNAENKADGYIQPFLVQEFLIKY